MRILIFTDKSCPRCPAAKELAEELKARGAHVEVYEKMEESATERAIASFLDVKSLPAVLVLRNHNIAAEWHGAVPAADEVMFEALSGAANG